MRSMFHSLSAPPVSYPNPELISAFKEAPHVYRGRDLPRSLMQPTLLDYPPARAGAAIAGLPRDRTIARPRAHRAFSLSSRQGSPNVTGYSIHQHSA